MKLVQSFWLALLPLGLCLGQGVDYYWVGGSGNWSEISHWMTTSGGNIQHAVLPTADDRVFFDENSFTAPNQEIVINRDNVFCAQMDWTGVTNSPTISGDVGVTININGGMNLSPDINFQFKGSFYFSGNGNQSIDFRNFAIGENLIINGESGSTWVLQNPITVGGRFRHQGGDFSTSGNSIICDQFLIEPKNSIQFDIGNTTIDVLGGTGYNDPSVLFKTDNLQIQADNSIINLYSEESYLQADGNQKISLNKVDFINDNGTAHVQGIDEILDRAPIGFNKINLASNAIIYGSNEFKEISITPGKSYQFERDEIQTIDRFNGTGTCSFPITMTTTTPGFPAYFHFVKNNTLEYINLQDIHASSDMEDPNIAQATTTGSVQGWNLDLRGVTTLYWVGGSGNWSDPTHWSYTSGGTGGACVPTFLDDVVFDGNSFTSRSESVTVDAQDIYFHTMQWDNALGTPRLAGVERQRMHIHGSIYLQPDMVWEYKGDLYFEAIEETHDILTQEHVMINDVFFTGYQAVWNLQSSFKVNRRILFKSSTLYTNSENLECESFESTGSLARSINLENSYVLLRSTRNFLVTWSIDNANLKFDAGNSIIELTGNLGVFNNNGIGSYNTIQYATVKLSSNRSSSISFDGFTTRIRKALYNSNTIARGNHQYDYLELFKGNNYTFGASGEIFSMDTLYSNGDCTEPISILSQSQIDQAQFNSNEIINVYYTSLEGIAISGAGTFTAYSGVDLGNNSGWIFEDVAARNLYWVGVNGDWHDPINWSLNSGGIGGECLPTPSDNVIFDKASFSELNDILFSSKDKIAICNNLLWNGPDTSTMISLEEIHCFGSFEIQSSVQAQINNMILRGGETHYLNFNNAVVGNLDINTTGAYICSGPIQARTINLAAGSLKTAGYPVTADYFDIQARTDHCSFDCAHSEIILNGKGSTSRGSFSVYGTNFTFQSQGSSFQFTHPNAKMYVHGALQFNHVDFLSKSGFASVQSNAQSVEPKPVLEISYLRFGGNGEIFGPHDIDSLVFTAGKGYVLESEVRQKIGDYWYMRGNNCSQIKLSASQPGIPSIVYKSSGEVNADFVQMQDQIAQGGASFHAGQNSTNINSSNQGWQFVTVDEDFLNGILGADRTLCRNEKVELNRQKTIAAEGYVWSDGSDGETIVVDETGNYWLKATFAQDCEIVDTIYVEVHNDLKPELGEDTTICDGENIIIATQQVTSAEYYWNDGSQGYSIETNEQGDYILTATLEHCIESDTIRVELLDPINDLLPAAIEACENSVIELVIHEPDVDIQWNTGATDTVIKVTEEGVYWATIVKSGCKFVDSTIVDFRDLATHNLPDTVSVCEDERVILDVTLRFPVGGVYAEYTHSFLDSLVPETQMFYYLVSDPECPYTDSILVEVAPEPYLSIDSVVQICKNSSAEIIVETDADELIWSHGVTGNMIDIEEPGTYQIIASKQGCIHEKSFEVQFFESIEFERLQDSVICNGSELLLDAFHPQVFDYKWSNGSENAETLIKNPGTYWVDMTDEYGCLYTDSVSIETIDCKALEVFIPNIFSPNGDGFNDRLEAYIGGKYPVNDFKMQIFDRWGNLIFESSEPGSGWDGTRNGERLSSQVFVCIVSINYQHPEGPREGLFTGDVLLNP